MNNHETQKVDGVNWWITTDTSSKRLVTPICPKHHLRLYPYPRVPFDDINPWQPNDSRSKLSCAEGPHYFGFPRPINLEKQYIIDLQDSEVFKKMSVIDWDGRRVPLAKDIVKNSKFFVRSQLSESKNGYQLVIYAGKKGKEKEYTQIFIDPTIKRMTFDGKDIDPSDLFLKIEATFKDGTKQEIKSAKSVNKKS